MNKIKIDYSQTLPWRTAYDNYIETEMPYGGRRIDMVQSAGSRDSSAEGSGPRNNMAGKFAIGELQPLTPTARGEMNGTEESYLQSDWGVFLSGSGDQIILDIIECPESMEDHLIIIHCSALQRGYISCTRVPKMMKHHVSYGFDMIIDKNVRDSLYPGEVIRGGTRITHTKARMESGDYGHGREANCAFISSFSTNEDTCAVLDTVIDDFKTTGSQYYDIYVDNEHVPLFIHGDDKHKTPIPRVGDVLEDGRVMAIRRRRRNMYLSHRTRRSMERSRHPSDTTYFCKRGSTVESVEVIKANTKPMIDYLPLETVRYLDQAVIATNRKYSTIMDWEIRLKREHGEGYLRDPSWNVMVRNAITHLYGNKLKQWYPKGYGKDKEVLGTVEDNGITGYLVRIKVRTIIKPHLGHKFNDRFGAKSTISEIRTKERMFTDKWGRTVEFITNGVANINRAIYGRLHSQYRGDARFHLLRRMRELYTAEGFNSAKDYYLGGIKVLSDKTFWKLEQMNEEVLDHHINWVIHEAPFIQLDDEIGDQSLTIHAAIGIENSIYAPPRDRLTFTDYRGRETETVCPIRVGPLYMSINEKIGSDHSACNVPMRQHSGTVRKLSSTDKKTSQVSGQSNRAFSEACFRMIMDSSTPENAKLILRDGTSYTSLRRTMDAIAEGEYVPDLEIESTDSRGTEILKAEMLCDGVGFSNTPRHITWGGEPLHKD